MKSKFLFLGTGSSMGVPVIGCHCKVCESQNPKNRRLRSASLLEIEEKRFLIDAGPDIRQQSLSYQIEKIDGFILTHSHYDHIGGFDDVKLYKKEEKKIPCLMLQETFKELEEKYHYFLKKTEEDPLNSPFFTWDLLKEPLGRIKFQGVDFEYVTFFQSKMKVLGLRYKNLAYISDIKQFDEDIFNHLKGVEILIVSALRESVSPMHFSLQEALDFSSRVGAGQVYLTHIAHEMEHEKMQKSLPPHVILAYDGLSFSF